MERQRTPSKDFRPPGRLIGVVLPVCAVVACNRTMAPSKPPPPIVASTEGAVRVLLEEGVDRVRFRSNRPLTIVGQGGVPATHTADQWFVVRATSAGRLWAGAAQSSYNELTLFPKPNNNVQVSYLRNGEKEWSDERAYFGAMRVRIDEDRGIRVINLVDLERYVECVVAVEVWPTFETEAFRAQAIAARTFVLYQMQRRKAASFDVSATQGAQVYRGIRRDATGRRAADAAAHTRGIVCTWPKDGADRLFSTYYSSVCGGMSQSAAIFGKADDIAPLAGGVACDYCRIAPRGTYRWGPTRLPADEVLRRLVTRYPKLALLKRLVRIIPAQTTPRGRLVRVKLVGSSGETHELLAERFRLAVGSDIMRSTDCEIRLENGSAVFSRGRGFGHGLGACQWGMQGQALEGKRADQILKYYFPGSRLQRPDRRASRQEPRVPRNRLP